MEKVLPKGWVKTEFANLIAHVIGGDWGKDSDVEDENFVEVYCIRGSEIKNWNTNFGNTSVVRKIKKSSLDSRRLINGDILLEISGGGPDQPVGRVVLITQNTFDRLPELPIVCTNFLRLIRPVSQINSNYFCSYLEYFYYSGEVVKYQGGSNNLRNLKYNEYEKIQIPLPPLPEQERIVAKLDKLFAQHEKIKAALDRIPQLLKNFRQQVLTQAVTGKLTEQWREGKELEKWKEEKLDNVTVSISDGDHQAPPKSEMGIPFLVISDVSSGRLDVNKSKRFVPVHYYDNLKENRKPKLNDILYTVTGSFGIPIIVDTEEPFSFQRHIGIIRPDKTKVQHKFLFYFLKSNFAYSQAIERATGTAQLTVSLGSLRNFDIPLPPIQEQHEIVRRVESLFAKADAIEARYDTLKAKLDALPQTILNKAFKGKLVPQLPTDGDAKDLLAEIIKLKGEAKPKKTKKK